MPCDMYGTMVIQFRLVLHASLQDSHKTIFWFMFTVLLYPHLHTLLQWCKYLSKNTLKYYLSRFFGVSVLYLTFNIYIFFIPKESKALFTPYIFPDTQKYWLHFECLAGQKMVQLTHVSREHPWSSPLPLIWRTH